MTQTILPALALLPLALAPLPALADTASPAPSFSSTRATAPTAAEAWRGVYGGVKAEAFTGDRIGYNYVGQGQTMTMPYDLEETTEWGVFLGYNFTYGNVVFGPELAYTDAGPVEGLTPYYQMTDALDLKLRAGYVTGRALLYGFLGYSRSGWDDGWEVSEIDGKIYGVGVDYLFDSGLFAGLEYARRDLDGHYLYGEDFVTVDTTSLALRVGYKF